MYWKLLVLLILEIQYFVNSNSEIPDSNSCTGLESCAACVQNPACAWCSQSDFHGSDKKQLWRCNTMEAHRNLGRFQCAKEYLFNHVNKLNILRNEPLSSGSGGRKQVPVRPQELSIRMRVGDPVTFTIDYQDLEDYPLDLYFLMDGTYTMKDDKEVLVSLGDAIGDRLRNLTSKFRQGFGTFVDKIASPFVSPALELQENPCANQNDVCTKPYGFKNHMKLSNDTTRFSDAVRNFVLSANTDIPEGGFDALMQVMVCEDQIGWSKQARRLILFATDAPFHYAGDGRLGGILLPNDGNCYLDERGEYYTNSLVTDYPSMSQINTKAKRHSMNIIFAVTAKQLPDYTLLTEVIEGSKSAELAKDSRNILNLLEDEYQRIKSSIEIKDTFPPEFFKVRYFTSCRSTGLHDRETNICSGLDAGAIVQFQVEIELIKCSPIVSEWKQQYRIYTVGVPDDIAVDVEMLCDCPCQERKIPNSDFCNRRGSEICGLCDCNTNFFGKSCECSSTERVVDLSTACRQDNSTEICNGRGNCHCGQCVCNEGNRYSGLFCECDNFSCLRIKEELCAGHGQCNCGTCKCEVGWEGPACDCSTSKDSCFAPGSKEECSGKGSCECNQCKCEGLYSGSHCEKCIHDSCPKECDKLKECVLCKIHNSGTLNAADCDLSCFQLSITPVDVIAAMSGERSNEVMCREEDPADSCVYAFSYSQSPDKKFKIQAQKTKECPEEAPIFWIISGVSSVVVLIGLILLCVYKGYQKMLVKREYKRYERERQAVKWGEQTNPIYNNPVGTFENPLYMGRN